MARSTKAAPVEEIETEATAEATPKQIINEGIGRVIEATGIDVQKNRYKAMRAIAYQAFVNAIEDGTFGDLVDEAIANVDDLPSGWEIEKPEAAPAPKAPAKSAGKSKSAPAKAPAAKAGRATAKAAPAKATARKRVTR